MKLMRIKGQSEDLHGFYDLSRGWSGPWRKPISSMLDLISYLEEVVDFPPQWVCTSHENLIFVGQGDYSQFLVSVHPLGDVHEGPAKAKFEITYRTQAPWSHVVGYAEDAEQCWLMIRSRLPEAALDTGQ